MLLDFVIPMPALLRIFHMSRHTFATMLLTLGADLYTVSKLLGHSQIKNTQVYAEIINRRKDEAVNLTDKAFD